MSSPTTEAASRNIMEQILIKRVWLLFSPIHVKCLPKEQNISN